MVPQRRRPFLDCAVDILRVGLVGGFQIDFEGNARRLKSGRHSFSLERVSKAGFVTRARL
jgi:hypothetical protein